METAVLAIVVFAVYMLVGWIVLSAVRARTTNAWQPGGSIGRVVFWPVTLVVVLMRRGTTPERPPGESPSDRGERHSVR